MNSVKITRTLQVVLPELETHFIITSDKTHGHHIRRLIHTLEEMQCRYSGLFASDDICLVVGFLTAFS